MTPAAVHFGQEEGLGFKGQAVLQTAHEAHPERFSRGHPRAPRGPGLVDINAPQDLATLRRVLIERH